MKMINYIFAILLSLLMMVGSSTLFYRININESTNSNSRFIENSILNAVEVSVRTSNYQPDVHIISFHAFIFCTKSEPIESYADWSQFYINSPLRAFKYALGQYTADY